MSPELSRVVVQLFSSSEVAALKALHPSGVLVSRERVDWVCQVSNGPHVVLQLREKLGKDAIKTVRARSKDREGRVRRPGLYQLTEQGRRCLEKLAREKLLAC